MVEKKLSSKKDLVVCIMGPTGVGKSSIGFDLAQQLSAEIVSVDSAIIYRGMDIGTAKPSKAEQQLIPHHLIDIRDPSTNYSAGDFFKDATKAINAIFAKNKTPLLIGGTMFYFKTLQQGISPLPPVDRSIREKLLVEAGEVGWKVLYRRLQQVDPEAAARIHPNDPQRLQRALEVYEQTGLSLSDWHKKNSPFFSEFRFLNIALTYKDRSVIHDRISKRFHEMLAAGFMDEVKELYARKDLHLNLPSIRSVGYRQAFQYLSGEFDFDTMVEKAIVATRQLAKRQLTWLRSWGDLNWIYLDEEDSSTVAYKLYELIQDQSCNSL